MGLPQFAREKSLVSFYCLFGEGPTVCVFQKILDLTTNVMDKFGHLGVRTCVSCWRAPHLGVCGCWHPGSHIWPWSYLSGAAFARRGLGFSTQSCKPEIATISSSRWTRVC